MAMDDIEEGNLKRAALGLEGALHMIAYHADLFRDKRAMTAYARKACEWAQLEDDGDGLKANPGKLTDLKMEERT